MKERRISKEDFPEFVVMTTLAVGFSLFIVTLAIFIGISELAAGGCK